MARASTEASLILSLTDEELLRTWRDLLKNNLDDKTCRLNAAGSSLKKTSFSNLELSLIRSGKYLPTYRCLQTKLALDGDYRSRRGRRGLQKPRQRKGVIGVKGKKVYIYQLGAFVRDGKRPTAGQNASHFYCDNPLCCNPKHLVWEDHGMNTTRYCCKYWRHKVKAFLCPHNPPCHGYTERRAL